MNTPLEQQGTLQDYLASFMLDRRANGVTPGTLIYYSKKLNLFARYCAAHNVAHPEAVTPELLRGLLLELAQTHNPGGCHAVYRSVRSFLRWYENEYEPANYKNPIRKVKAPKVPTEPLIPVSLDNVSALLATCQRATKGGGRDYAILLTLLDTGLRAAELVALDVEDVELATGAILVKQGKGRKPRTVFAGQRTRKALRAYIRTRRTGPVFLARGGERITYSGLRLMVDRRADEVGIARPGLHSFRRAFAINCLRAGMDVFTLQRLLGHATLDVLRRYLSQTSEDLQIAHRAASPADKLQLSQAGQLAGALFVGAGVPVDE